MSEKIHIGDFAENLRDAFHYPKTNANRYERQTSSTLDFKENIRSLVAFEEDGIGKVIMKTFKPLEISKDESKILTNSNNPSRPFILAWKENEISTIWIEFVDKKWQISYVESGLNANNTTTQSVHRSDHLCIHPTMCISKGVPYIFWSGYDEKENKFSIYSSKLEDKGWSKPKIHSKGIGNCFRPDACSNDRSILIAWDQSHEEKQYIRLQEIEISNGEVCEYTMSRKGERFIYPKVAVRDCSTYSVACISISDVIDENLGIVDHKTGIAFAEISKKNLTIYPSCVAHLNEGLLGIKNYTPYFGIRRKCNLVATGKGDIWLFWEMRFEDEREDVIINFKKDNLSYEHYGYLIGMKFDGKNWGTPLMLHQGGTCYSIAGFNKKGELGIAFLDQANIFILPEFKQKFINVEEGIVLEIDRRGEERWNKPLTPAIKEQRYYANVREKKLALYWVDTHVHSNFSPDAEGEPDELILYGRDIAGLDAMAMVDNDYYPHAGLMKAEWLIQQELAKAYTIPGEFVVFPGYEFTCHEKTINPNFNHRYVIYPKGGQYFSRLDAETRIVGDLAKKVQETYGIMVAHHPTWDLTGGVEDQYVEICSSWRISIEEKDFIKQHLLKDQKFAFIGSSDTHRACPGLGGALTGIFAEELEPNSLFEGYKKRRTIATQGLKILIDFKIGNLFIGEEGSANKNSLINLKVNSPEELEFVEIICNDRIVKRYENPGKSLFDEIYDTQVYSGTHFYYVRVKAVGNPSFNEPQSIKTQHSGPFIREGDYSFNFARAKGPFAWSTPIWVEIN